MVEKHRGTYYITVEDLHDVFRVKNYPRKVIHNLRELRRWLKKDYFKLPECQINRLCEFWEKYPKGIIMFEFPLLF